MRSVNVSINGEAEVVIMRALQLLDDEATKSTAELVIVGFEVVAIRAAKPDGEEPKAGVV